MTPGLQTLAGLAIVLLSCVAPVCPASAKTSEASIVVMVEKLTRSTTWKAVSAVQVQFRTYHPQGMVKIGDEIYVSSVEIRTPPRRQEDLAGGFDRDAGAGVGHLFKMSLDGTLLADLVLGEGSVYHPGGIDFDGRSIWVPVSEYRPKSRAIVYKVDPRTMKATEVFRFQDHLGGVIYDRRRRQLHAINWGSRDFYTWPRGFGSAAGKALDLLHVHRSPNPDQYIDYQDCHFVAGRLALCSGLGEYITDGKLFQLGGVDLVEVKSKQPVWQAPIELRSPSGRVMTQNPAFFEAKGCSLRAYFMPDDDTSTLFVFDAGFAAEKPGLTPASGSPSPC